MGKEIERLAERLEKMGTRNFSVFRGEDPNATPENVAREANKALDQIEKGDFEEIGDLDEGC